jgi:hypothetical protein
MRKLQIARALSSAASDPRCNTNCGSSVDGTVAVNMAFHQFFRRVAFLTRLESRRAPIYRKIDTLVMRPGANDKPLPSKNESRAIRSPRTVFASGRVDTLRRRSVPIR